MEKTSHQINNGRSSYSRGKIHRFWRYLTHSHYRPIFKPDRPDAQLLDGSPYFSSDILRDVVLLFILFFFFFWFNFNSEYKLLILQKSGSWMLTFLSVASDLLLLCLSVRMACISASFGSLWQRRSSMAHPGAVQAGRSMQYLVYQVFT
jgi:hypothetical protein